jgi:hypothetical protein
MRKKASPWTSRRNYATLVKSKQFVLLSFYPDHILDFDACSIIKEMHDRIIVGAARRMNAKLPDDRNEATFGDLFVPSDRKSEEGAAHLRK